MMPLLPTVAAPADYFALHRRTDLWLPAIREICRRHGVGTEPLSQQRDGGNVIFFAGPRHVIKLVAPLFREEHQIERACLHHVAGRLPVATPDVLAEGAVEDWPYAVLERLPGQALTALWPTLEDAERASIARSLGELIAALHELPPPPPGDGLDALHVDWPAFALGQRARCVEHHRRKGAPEALLAGLPALLDAAEPLYPPRPHVLVHADVSDPNILAERRAGACVLTGLIDFGDSMVGHPDYDLVTTAEFLLCGRPALLRAYLLAYGLREDELDDALSTRLMAITLSHRFGNLPRLVQRVGRPEPYASLEDLTRAAWGFR